jgi:RND family efflux transporter MFP subunit
MLLLASCKTEYEGQNPTPTDPDAGVPVRTVTLAPASAPLPIQAGGSLASREEARLSFKVGGIIDRMYAREGVSVRRGALLAELKTDEIDARVRQAEQAHAKANRDLARIRRLYADSAATYESVQNLETASEVAASDLEIATFNQRFARIRAPFDGRIVKRLVEPGELISPGTPVYQLVGDRGDGYVLRVGVSDRDVLHLAPGDSASVRLDAYPDRAFVARVTEIGAAADPRSGAFEVEVTLAPTNFPLRIGFVGRVDLFPSRQPAYYHLPLDALVDGEGQRIRVFSFDEQNLARGHSLRVTRLLDSTFVITADQLAGVDRIITAGARHLREGDRVNIIAK